MDSLPKTPDSGQPCEAVPCSALILLLARWRELAQATEDRAKYAGKIGNYSVAHALDWQAQQRFKCADELEAEMRAGKKENDEHSGGTSAGVTGSGKGDQ